MKNEKFTHVAIGATIDGWNVNHSGAELLFNLLNEQANIPHSTEQAVAARTRVSRCLPSNSLPSSILGKSSP